MIELMPWVIEKPAPATKVNSEAMKAQKNVSFPWPNGWVASAGRLPRVTATNSRISVVVSARECAASDSMAAEPLSTPATALVRAMSRFITPATTTTTRLSPEPSDPFGPPPTVIPPVPTRRLNTRRLQTRRRAAAASPGG
jgi:hypothetical protein